MYIHTNTNTIYQWWCKSWSLRQVVQSLFSWFSRLPMTASPWQVWRSLRHNTGCTFRQSLPLHKRDGSGTLGPPSHPVKTLGSHGEVVWELRRLYQIFILSSVWSGESWTDLERLGEKWWKSLIISDNNLKLAWLSRSMIFTFSTDTSI
jgi:hypothetical protein